MGSLIVNDINGDVFKPRSHQLSDKVFGERVLYGFHEGIIRGNKWLCFLPEITMAQLLSECHLQINDYNVIMFNSVYGHLL